MSFPERHRRILQSASVSEADWNFVEAQESEEGLSTQSRLVNQEKVVEVGKNYC